MLKILAVREWAAVIKTASNRPPIVHLPRCQANIVNRINDRRFKEQNRTLFLISCRKFQQADIISEVLTKYDS